MVMAVRSSMNSTGLFDGRDAHALRSTKIELAGIHDGRIPRSIPGREPEPIIGLPLPGILLAMINRFGRNSATTLWICLVLATGAGRMSGALASESGLADRVVVHKFEHKLYLYSGDQLLGVYKVALG